ncbi:uncharacterized protein LOC129261800 [Lytechinus pictus]|uniref:uncharacterized protein LOC129261800 n=1 Tax=Lytechinus pictus TaxID=7653 RepID=UPI0030B9D814
MVKYFSGSDGRRWWSRLPGSSRKSNTMDSDSEDQYGEDDTDHNDHRIGMDGDEPLTTSTPLYSQGKKKKKRPGLWKRFKHKTKPMRKISTQVMEKAHHKSHGHSDDENISSARSRSFVSKSEPQLHHDSKNYNSLPRSHRFGGSVIDRTKLFVETDGRQTYSSDSDTGGARTNGTGIVRRSSSSSSRKILSFDVNSESRHSKSLPTDGELDMDVPQLAASVSTLDFLLKIICIYCIEGDVKQDIVSCNRSRNMNTCRIKGRNIFLRKSLVF